MSITTPPKLMSKDKAARELGCDRRTLSKIIDAFEIDSAGKSAAGHPMYDLEELREAVMDHKAAQLPPMTQNEAFDGLFSMMELGWLALDYLQEILPPATMQDAIVTAMQRRKDKRQPQFLWLRESS
jgi:hypothetical protein